MGGDVQEEGVHGPVPAEEGGGRERGGGRGDGGVQETGGVFGAASASGDGAGECPLWFLSAHLERLRRRRRSSISVIREEARSVGSESGGRETDVETRFLSSVLESNNSVFYRLSKTCRILNKRCTVCHVILSSWLL